MTQTEEFMFQNVAYRPTVYITGVKGVSALLCSERLINKNHACKHTLKFPRNLLNQDMKTMNKIHWFTLDLVQIVQLLSNSVFLVSFNNSKFLLSSDRLVNQPEASPKKLSQVCYMIFRFQIV